MKLFKYTLLFLFASGCAVHSPMSEMLMFQQKQTKEDSTYKARYSHSILSYSTEFYSTRDIAEYTEQSDYLDSDTTYQKRLYPTISTHAIFMSNRTDDFALSLAAGSAFGLDATVNLAGNLYLTGGISNFIEPKGQVIVQQRLLDGNPVGLSLGATYFKNFKIFTVQGGGCVLCPNSTDLYSTSAGLRTLFTLSNPSSGKNSRPYIYATGSYNYDFTMDTFYPKIGLAIGIY